jgi:hypothetical protein
MVRVRWLGKYLGHTPASWRDGFCYDMHPDNELRIWGRIAKVVDHLWQEQPKPLKKLNRERLSRLVVAVCSGMVDIPSQMPDVSDEAVDLVADLSGKLSE